jgi:hypothetical protein
MGTVIATGKPCLDKDGVTDITLIEPAFTIQLEHVHHKLPSIHGKTSFTYDGKKYHWKGHTALVEEETGKLLAAFHPKFLNLHFQKLGNLIITAEGEKLLDIVVTTCLVVQERSDEHKQAVSPNLYRYADLI